MSNSPDLGLEPAQPLTSDERAELDFLRYETGFLQRRLGVIEDELEAVRQEKKRMSNDFTWVLKKLESSPAGPLLMRRDGFRRLMDTWVDGNA